VHIHKRLFFSGMSGGRRVCMDVVRQYFAAGRQQRLDDSVNVQGGAQVERMAAARGRASGGYVGLRQSRNWAVESDLVIVLVLGQDRHLVQYSASQGAVCGTLTKPFLIAGANKATELAELASAQPGDPDRLDLGLIAMSETVTTLHLYAGRKDALELRGRPTMQRALPIFGMAAV
jgi:hypothetical protein